ncbi:MAG TPA: hypothetical protein VEL07_18100 [Planctomycetota bacterium]|nr:hypothetical protein [Planctomycetota bacterium]
MLPIRGLTVLVPLIALVGCASSGGDSKPATAAASGGGADQSEAPATGGEIRIFTVPTVVLTAATDGSGGSLLSLRQYIINASDATLTYEIHANGASRGVFTIAPHRGVQTEHAWPVAAGRVEVETVLDPNGHIDDADQSDNDSLIIVDVPEVASPTARAGTDIAFAYPPYMTFTPEQDQNREAGYGDWCYLVNVPMRNNGSTTLTLLRMSTSGDHTSTSQGSGEYVPGTVKTIGVGRGAMALQRLRIGVTLDPTNEVAEDDEGNNTYQLDVVAPPVRGPLAHG